MENRVHTANTQIAITDLLSAAKHGTKEEVDQAYAKAMAMVHQLQKDIDKQREAAFRLANML